jgi:hypothetical protein
MDENGAAGLAPHDRVVAEVVGGVVRDLVGAGRALLVVSAPDDGSPGAEIALVPSRSDACPLTVRCLGPGELDVAIGRHGLTATVRYGERWRRGELEPLKELLREWVRAVVAGRYEERVPGGAPGRGRGTLVLAYGPVHFGRAPRSLGRRTTVRYAPY